MLTKPELTDLKETYKLKAYYIEVEDGLESEGEVVFAKSEEEAKQRVGAIRDGYWESEYLSKVERKPEFDKFADLGYVPFKEKFEAGWWGIDCDWCGREISDSAIDNYEDELEEWEIYHKERESAPEPYNPQFEGRNMTFCCTTCQTKWHERIDKLTQLKVEVQANLETLYPECTVKYTGGNYGDGTVDFELTVPGLKYKITYESNHPDTMLVSDCDIEAWKTYKESKINNV
jgi:hypothetical protein